MRAQALQSVAVAGSKPYGSSSNSLLLPTPLQPFLCNSSFTGKACSKCARVASGPRLPKRPRIIGPAGHLCWQAKACQGKKHVVVRPCGGCHANARLGWRKALVPKWAAKMPFCLFQLCPFQHVLLPFPFACAVVNGAAACAKAGGRCVLPCFSNAGGRLGQQARSGICWGAHCFLPVSFIGHCLALPDGAQCRGLGEIAVRQGMPDRLMRLCSVCACCPLSAMAEKFCCLPKCVQTTKTQ